MASSAAPVRIAAPISPTAGLRTAACAAPSMAGCSMSAAAAWRRRRSRTAAACATTSARRPIRWWKKQHPVRLSGTGRAAAVPAFRLLRRARHAHLRVQGVHRLQLAAVARSRHRSRAHLVPASLLSTTTSSGDTYGRLFRDKSANSEMPITQIVREFTRPQIDVEPTDYGLRILTTRRLSDASTHIRVTNLLFPHAFHIPLSREMTITQWHVPTDDLTHYWYAIFTSFGGPVDKDEMRRQRLELYELPDYVPRKNKNNNYGFDPHRAGARDLHRHGRGHQCARPVGLQIHGRDPGPHQRAPRAIGQGDQRLPAHPAPCDRRGVKRRHAADGAGHSSRRRSSRSRRRSTASARPTTGRATGAGPTRRAARPRAGRMEHDAETASVVRQAAQALYSLLSSGGDVQFAFWFAWILLLRNALQLNL